MIMKYRKINFYLLEIDYVFLTNIIIFWIQKYICFFILNQNLLSRLNKSSNTSYIIHVHTKECHFTSYETLCRTHTNVSNMNGDINSKLNYINIP